MKRYLSHFGRFLSSLSLVALLAPHAAVADMPLVLAVPSDVRDLLRNAQAAALPSASIVTQDIGVVSVAPAMGLYTPTPVEGDDNDEK